MVLKVSSLRGEAATGFLLGHWWRRMLSCLLWMQLTCLKFFLHCSMITPTRSSASNTCALWYFRLTRRKLLIQVWYCSSCLCVCLFDRLRGWVDCRIGTCLSLMAPLWNTVTAEVERHKHYTYTYDLKYIIWPWLMDWDRKIQWVFSHTDAHGDLIHPQY